MIRFIFENILVALDNFSQYKNLKFLKKLYGQTFDIVLDIGCHKGETIKSINKAFNVKMIYAFDADKNLIEHNKNLNFSNVSFIPKGVGETDGKKKMFKYKFTPINSFVELNKKSKYTKKRQRILNLIYGIKNQNQIVWVDLIKLDTFIKLKKIKRIDLVKIDTEGYELNVLKGFSKEIKKVKIILLEHHYDSMLKKNYKFSNVHNFLKKKGFKKVYKNKMLLRNIFEYIYVNQRSKKY